MLNKVVSAVVLASLLVPAPCRAEDSSNQGGLVAAVPVPVAGEADPGKAISPMKKGQKAPYTGVMLSPRAVSSVIADYEAVPEKIKLEVKKAVAENQTKCDRVVADASAKCEADKAALKAALDADEKEIEAYSKELKILREKQTNPLVWTGIGVVGGVAVTLLTVFVVSAATK